MQKYETNLIKNKTFHRSGKLPSLHTCPVQTHTHTQSGTSLTLLPGSDVKLRARAAGSLLHICDKQQEAAVCVVWESTMHQQKTAESAVVTWTHFYCNSSIESKKVLININTMPMFRSPPRTDSTPPRSLHKKKKREKEKHEKKKKKATTRVVLFTGGGFSFFPPPRLSLDLSPFLCTWHTSLENNVMHIRRIRTSNSWILFFFFFFFLKLFPVKLIINDSIQLEG